MGGSDSPWLRSCEYDHHDAGCEHIPPRLNSLYLTPSVPQATIANVARDDAAIATGITYLFRTMGQALGVTLSGALLQAILTKQLRKRITIPEAFEVRSRYRPDSLGVSVPADPEPADG